MLQLNYIRQNTEEVKNRLQIKNFEPISLVDDILELDEQSRKNKMAAEAKQAEINSLSKQIGMHMAQQNEQEAAVLKEQVTQLKNGLNDLLDNLKNIEKELTDKLIQLPNLPNTQVPKGTSAADNVVVRSGGEMPDLPADAKPQWELLKEYDLISFELGVKLTGSGFPVYKNKGAKLERALIEYFLDYNTQAGYTEYYPPFMVNEATAYGTGQLPDKEGQMYYVAADNFYLIPTAEVPLTNIYRDDIIASDDLPVKMTGYTPCFRREAGSFGADVRALNRVHQFDKVEIVQIVKPETSYDVLEEMVNHVERLIQYLELPYRILKLSGGDMSFASALTYDFEVYSAAQQKWLEVSSVSNFETYQTNRMKIRYKDESGKTQLLHSLNGSSLALPRIYAALIENNQKDDGIHLPKAIQSYYGGSIITK